MLSRLLLPLSFLIFGLLARFILKSDPFDESQLYDAPDINTNGIKYITIPTYDPNVNLQTIEMGDYSKPLVIFLHGFPETAQISGHHQLHAFAKHYYILAPDMRGYNKSDKPPNMKEYYLTHLIADIHALVHQYARRKEVFLVAHDWGAIIAWNYAIKFPDTIIKLGIMNGPHIAALEKYGSNSISQLKKSWYIQTFQLPYPLPEYKFSKNNYETLQNLYAEWNSKRVSRPVMTRLLQAWSEPGHIHASINWYRNLVTGRLIHEFFGNKTLAAEWLPSNNNKVTKPTILIWGLNDACMDPELGEITYERAIDDLVKKQSKFITYEDAGHFVQHEKADEVTKQLLSFFKR